MATTLNPDYDATDLLKRVKQRRDLMIKLLMRIPGALDLAYTLFRAAETGRMEGKSRIYDRLDLPAVYYDQALGIITDKTINLALYDALTELDGNPWD